MKTFLEQSVFFGAILSLCAYGIGIFLRKKFKSPIFNPLLISVIITVCVLVVGKIDYDAYLSSAKYISYLLTPATVALAIPLYEQLETLKSNPKAILVGIFSGTLISLLCIFSMSVLFGLSHSEYISFLPKSITTAIGMVLSEELGGYPSITAIIIVITGVLGNVIGEFVLKVFKISHPVAKGVALGTSAHAIGTTKALELGRTEGAISSLSIVISGIITVVFASMFANFM